MEGILFYWFSWIGWVVTTFMMRKNRTRLIISAYLLVLIIFSNRSINIVFFGHSVINLSYLAVLVGVILALSQLKKVRKILIFFYSIMIAGLYAAFRIFELIDPVWIFFNRAFMLSSLLFIITLLLVDSYKMRLLVVSAGALQGEWLFYMVTKRYGFSEGIGTYHFLDVLTMSIVFISAWTFFENISYYFDRYLYKNVRQKEGLR